jgi:hypothetical protein
MTLIQSPDNKPSTHSPSDPRLRTNFLSSKPTQCLKTASMESLSSTRKTRVSNSFKSISTQLKISHSISPPPDPPPIPVLPQRPLRNPARRDTNLSKPKKRPSTATGVPEQVAPWANVSSFSNGNNSTINIPNSSTVTSSHSRSLFPATGPIEVVTPWELYPVQATTNRHTQSTGPTAEVTPWELYPVPTPKRSRSSLATGLVEDVTPWELYPVSIPEEPVKSTERHTRLSVSRLDLTFYVCAWLAHGTLDICGICLCYDIHSLIMMLT